MLVETRDEKVAFDRYDKAVSILMQLDNQRGIKLVKELVTKCINYINITAVAEAEVRSMKSGINVGEDRRNVQAATERLDQMRKLAHEALISQLMVVNRYLFNIEETKQQLFPGGIFSLDSHILLDPRGYGERARIGDWAKYLTEALYRRGLIKRE